MAVGQYLDVAGRAHEPDERATGRAAEGRRLHGGGPAAGRRRLRRRRGRTCAPRWHAYGRAAGRGLPVARRPASMVRRRRARDADDGRGSGSAGACDVWSARRSRPRRSRALDGWRRSVEAVVSDDLDLLRRAFRDQTVVPDRHGSPRRRAVRGGAVVRLARRGGVGLDAGRATARGSTSSRDPRVSIVIDRGRDWAELAGVRIEGVAETFPAEHPDLRGPMSAWHEKYRTMLGGDSFERLTRDVVASRLPPGRPLAGRTPGITAEGSSPGALRCSGGSS